MKEPYIIVADSDEATEYHIYVEMECVVSSPTLADALIDLICTYFIFNIEYPKPMYPALVFLQHFVMGLTDGQKVPTSLRAFCSSLMWELYSIIF